MDILLDTHSVLWFFIGSDKMSGTAKNIIQNPDNVIYVSIATIWEVAIKISINKLSFDGGIDGFIKSIEDNGFSLLEISPNHIKTISNLPFIHRDPFDRMLIAQAINEDMAIMTIDESILRYNIKSVW